ncbi:MAG: M23 family metallopeptidase [Bacillota bacterium]|nr:M23 family metallopeptidase [Bacillota bacterium]
MKHITNRKLIINISVIILTIVTVSLCLYNRKDNVYTNEKSIAKIVKKQPTINNDTIAAYKVLSKQVVTEPHDKVIEENKNPTTAKEAFLTMPSKGDISSAFGMRWGRMHEGIDIAANNGNPICAAMDGTVSFAGWEDGYGNLVKIDHADGIQTLYGHASKLEVKEGQSVKTGDEIAKVGSTGDSTGPHVHFEVRLNGKAVNPVDYLK